jgi:hypothetical protein
MATSRPFAYNTGSTISGTEQIGDLAIGVDLERYDEDWGGVKWWMGPDEDLGYVIAQSVPSGNQPNPVGIPAYVGFFRSVTKTEQSFVNLTNIILGTSFTTGDQCVTYLNTNGYWTSYTPTPSGLILDWNIQNNGSYSGVGTTISDLKTNSNGNIVGTITYNSSSPRYLEIQGATNEYITTVTNLNSVLSPPTTGKDISIFLWIYPTSDGVILSEQGSSSPDTGWYDSQIQLVSGVMEFSVWPWSTIISSSISTPFNNWYYVGLTYSGTSLTVYVNGQTAGNATFNRDTPGNNGFGLYYNLGYPTATRFPGSSSSTFRFGAMQVYNQGLNSSQVLQNFNNTKTTYGL